MSLFIFFFIVGCSEKTISQADLVLVQQLIRDYQLYFDFPLVLNHYSVRIQPKQTFISNETNKTAYNLNRVTLVNNREAKHNEVIRVTGEYKDKNLNGVFVKIHSEPSESSEANLEQLAVTFLSKYNLAEQVSLIDQKVKENEREIIFRFQTEQDQIIKVYVNKDLNEVVGFLLTDGEDL